MNLRDKIKQVYFDETQLTYKDYEKSRNYFLYEGSAAVGIFSLTSGAFLAGFANYMGASDQFNGIIAAIPALAGIIQIFSSIVFEKLKHRKFLISISSFAFRLLLGIMFFIPIFIQGSLARLISLAGMYGFAYLIASFISPPASNWMVDLTPDDMRGRYFAKKDAYSLAFVTVLTLVMGKVVDIFRMYNNEFGGFISIAVVVLILTCVDFYFMSKVKEPIEHKVDMTISVKNTFFVPLKNKGFRKVIILFIIWNIAFQIGGPFFSVYMVTGLKLNYTYIMIVGVVSSLSRVFSAKPWGKLADHKSWFFVTKLSIGLLAITHASWFFVNSITMWILIPLLNVIAGVAWCGINIALFNIQFLFAPKEGRTMYLGANAAIGGVIGFISTIIGSYLIELFKNYNTHIGVFSISNMQYIFAISGVLLLVCVLYVNFFMKARENKNRL
jgi:hypothetical protein